MPCCRVDWVIDVLDIQIGCGCLLSNYLTSCNYLKGSSYKLHKALLQTRVNTNNDAKKICAVGCRWVRISGCCYRCCSSSRFFPSAWWFLPSPLSSTRGARERRTRLTFTVGLPGMLPPATLGSEGQHPSMKMFFLGGWFELGSRSWFDIVFFDGLPPHAGECHFHAGRTVQIARSHSDFDEISNSSSFSCKTSGATKFLMKWQDIQCSVLVQVRFDPQLNSWYTLVNQHRPWKCLLFLIIYIYKKVIFPANVRLPALSSPRIRQVLHAWWDFWRKWWIRSK